MERLVILHEEAEDGNAMPDLERPVQAVSIAVTNLVKVVTLKIFGDWIEFMTHVFILFIFLAAFMVVYLIIIQLDNVLIDKIGFILDIHFQVCV